MRGAKFGALVWSLGMSSTVSDGIATTIYDNKECSGAPNSIGIAFGSSASCKAATCVATDEPTAFSTVSCGITSDAKTFAASAFGTANTYIYFRQYDDDVCTNELGMLGVRQVDTYCESDDTTSKSYSVAADGTLKVKTFKTGDCTGTSTTSDLAQDTCVNQIKAYVFQPAKPTTTKPASATVSSIRQSGMTATATVIVVAAVTAMLVAGSPLASLA